MSLADEITDQLNTAKRSQIERVINQLEGEDLRAFIGAMHNVNIPAPAISRALAVRNIQLDSRRISEYRNNGGFIRYGLDGKRVSGK
jgi:ABC-type lipoprotein export system ATPase subunit